MVKKNEERVGLSVTALVLSILNLLFFWFPFIGWLSTTITMVFCLVSIKNWKTGTTAKVAGIIALTLTSGIIVLKVLILIAFFGIYMIPVTQ